jgi:hypothetical protein
MSRYCSPKLVVAIVGMLLGFSAAAAIKSAGPPDGRPPAARFLHLPLPAPALHKFGEASDNLIANNLSCKRIFFS